MIFSQEPIIQRCDEADPITTVSKPMHRYFWKRTKRFFRRLFCCGDVKVRHSSSDILAEPTDSASDKIDIGSLPATENPVSTDSTRSIEDFLPQMTLQVEKFRAPIETDVQPGRLRTRRSTNDFTSSLPSRRVQ